MSSAMSHSSFLTSLVFVSGVIRRLPIKPPGLPVLCSRENNVFSIIGLESKWIPGLVVKHSEAR